MQKRRTQFTVLTLVYRDGTTPEVGGRFLSDEEEDREGRRWSGLKRSEKQHKIIRLL